MVWRRMIVDVDPLRLLGMHVATCVEYRQYCTCELPFALDDAPISPLVRNLPVLNGLDRSCRGQAIFTLSGSSTLAGMPFK